MVNLKKWCACACLLPMASFAAPDTRPDIDELGARVMQAWQVPGVALGLIEDGRVTLAKGYGWRDIDGQEPMTAQTVLGIASNSESFNAVLSAMLVDDQKLAWDQPVQAVLPEFRLKDAYAGRHITLRDLHIHNSGLPQDDVAWYMQALTGAQLLDRLPHLEPTASFRRRFQYQNLMYTTASLAQERVSRQSWAQLVHQRLFVPLGMHSSSASLESGLIRHPQAAKIYEVQGGQTRAIAYKNIDAIKGAGAINSTVDDVLKYLRFRLGLSGKDLLSPGQAAYLDQPQILVDSPINQAALSRPESLTYALGAMRENHRGYTVLWHTGGIDGFTSAIAWIPEKKWALVVLTNSMSSAALVLFQTLADRAVGAQGPDRLQQALVEQAKTQEAEQAQQQAFFKGQIEGARPSRDLAEFAGCYVHPFYGEVHIQFAGQGLALQWGDHAWPLTHRHRDVFYAADGDRGAMGGAKAFWLHQPLGFVTDADGKVAALEVSSEVWAKPQRFVRQAASK